MLEITNSPQIGFKSYPYQAQQHTSMPQYQPMDRDMLMLQKAQKKEANKEKWYKTGVIAQVGLALAFGTMAVTSILTHKLNKNMVKAQGQKAEAMVKNVFEDISKELGIEDMALSKELKKLVDEIKYGIENRDVILERGGDGVKSILLYGPPGTGKTTYAKAIAKMFPKSKFASLDVTKMKDKYVGETEKNVNALIDKICAEADAMQVRYNEKISKIIGEDIVKRGNEVEIAQALAKAKKAGKEIPEMERIFVFADEIDSVMMIDTSTSAKFSNDVLNEFKKGFTEKLGKRKNIITLGATNLEIDAKKAMTADGKRLDKPMLDRFDYHLFVGNPNKDQLKAATIKKYSKLSLISDELKNESSPKLDKICEFLATEDFGTSFRKMNAVIKKAGNNVKTDPNAKVGAEDMVRAIKEMKDSLNVSDAQVKTLCNDLGIDFAKL